MAFAVRLSQRARCCLLTVQMALTLLHAALGLAILVITAKTPSLVGVHLLPHESALIDQVFGSYAVIGFCVFLANLAGARICASVKKPHRHPQVGFLLLVWSLLLVVLCGLEAGAAALARPYASALHDQLRGSLHRGAGQYLSDPWWKATLDNLQQRFNCCGIDHYTDWHRVSWLHPEKLHGDTATVQRFTQVDGRVMPPTAPFSCCVRGGESPCLHDPLQQVRQRQLWEERQRPSADSLGPVGCLAVVAGPLALALRLTFFLGASGAALVPLQLLLVRYVYTAARSAALCANPKGPGWGWLVGRGDCGAARGPTLEVLDARAAERAAKKAEAKAEKEAKAKAEKEAKAGTNVEKDVKTTPADEGKVIKLYRKIKKRAKRMKL